MVFGRYAFVSGIAVASIAVQASALSFDQNITPDVLYGSGNGNGGWTVDIQNNIEVGLRTHQRTPTPADVFNSNGDGTYSWNSGVSSGKAEWNYDFSINLNQDGSTPTRRFDAYGVELCIDLDPGVGTNYQAADPLTFWTDNAYGTNATANGGGDDSAPTNADLGVTDGYYVAQNSQNIQFLNGLFPSLDGATGPATWDFKLRVFDPASGDTLAQTTISVLIDGGATVPEPVSAALGLMGLGALAAATARRRVG